MKNRFINGIFRRIKSAAQMVRLDAQLGGIRRKNKLNILDSYQTLDLIADKNLSIARFGDGEFNIMFHTQGVNFQSGSTALSQRLREVYLSNKPEILVCIPHALNSLCGLNDHARRFYAQWTTTHYAQLAELLNMHDQNVHIFGDTNISRPYKDWKSPEHAERVFPKIKQLWQSRDILIVEGEKTRLGVGNDLFDNARSIKRILGPAVNAFDRYDEILQSVLDLHQNELVILALGPAATVLAYDLAVRGIRAMDLGHVDIEYEWYLRRASSKVAIPGKYTNEASDGNRVADCEDPVYLSQIIAKVGVL